MKQAAARYFSQPLVGLLARTGLHPNAVTVLGFLASGGAAWLLAQGSFFWGGVVVLLGSALDMVDGALARATGRVTPFGALLDSTLDRLAEALILGGLALHFSTRGDALGVFLTLAALISSFLVSYVRARAEALGLKGEVGLAARPERIIILSLGLLLGQVALALGAIAVLASSTAAWRLLYGWRQSRG
ncbi:MAG: CDP-alcohol phosphatidyltransferase family protein [Chloroflexi bacterium]|nr:CDP-alcohol phosphatidyltransferase family protein [Chloroflexota bacterium]